jgi:hypothetical protein
MTRRAAVLAHLAEYPDLTAGELARAIGARGSTAAAGPAIGGQCRAGPGAVPLMEGTPEGATA